MAREIVKPEYISMKNDPDFDERWLHEQLIEDPSLLGLGDLDVRDSERSQPSGGRLDLLLSDPDSLRRYEVELQLGAVDESHLIRTIEYWDIERTRYRQYEHVPVLVAESVTSRFLNVIRILRRSVPLVAIQLQLVEVKGAIALIASTVVDHVTLGINEEDKNKIADREYWKSKDTDDGALLKMTERIIEFVREITEIRNINIHYTKGYIRPNSSEFAENFMSVRFRKTSRQIHIGLALKKEEEVTEALDKSNLGDPRYSRDKYRFLINEYIFEAEKDLIARLIRRSLEEKNKKVAPKFDGAGQGHD